MESQFGKAGLLCCNLELCFLFYKKSYEFTSIIIIVTSGYKIRQQPVGSYKIS